MVFGLGRSRGSWRSYLLVAVALSCARSVPPETEPNPALRGLDFAAELDVLSSSPPRLQATVEIENRRLTPVTLTFPIACIGLLRAYEEQDGMRAPVWEQAPPVGCDGVPSTVELEPGEEQEISIPPVEVEDVLGPDLPHGTYRFTVFLQPNGHLLEIHAGEADLERAR